MTDYWGTLEWLSCLIISGLDANAHSLQIWWKFGEVKLRLHLLWVNLSENLKSSKVALKDSRRSFHVWKRETGTLSADLPQQSEVNLPFILKFFLSCNFTKRVSVPLSSPSGRRHERVTGRFSSPKMGLWSVLKLWAKLQGNSILGFSSSRFAAELQNLTEFYLEEVEGRRHVDVGCWRRDDEASAGFKAAVGSDALQSRFLMNRCRERRSRKAMKAQFGSKLSQHNKPPWCWHFP